MKIKFLSIDPSFTNTGIAYGFIDTAASLIFVEGIDLLQTSKTKHKQIRVSSDTISRCREINAFVQQALKKVKPKVVFVETPSGSQNASAMKGYGIVCMLIATIKPHPIEITPMEVKKVVMKKKTASKREIIDWAYKNYPHLNWKWRNGVIIGKSEHVADAIAITHAGIHTSQFTQLKALIE